MRPFTTLWLGAYTSLGLACSGPSSPEPVAVTTSVEVAHEPVQGVEAEVLAVPRPHVQGSGAGLLYEVILRNRTEAPLRLSEAVVTGPSGPLVNLTGEALAQDIALLRSDASRVSGLRREPLALRDDSSPRDIVIPSGLDAALYVQVSGGPDFELPQSVTHSFLLRTSSGFEHWQDVAAVAVSTAERPVIAAPLAGGGWFVINAPRNGSPHRRALFRIDGGYWLAQRFAVDLVRVSQEGSTFSGDPTTNESYHAWGAEVLAVSAGVVQAVHDGVPENTPGGCPRPMDPTAPCDRSTAVPMTLESLAGNTIVLEIGPEAYVVFAHLQPGSIRVSAGDRVTAGQVIASLGNSGNSTEPHLHLHLCDRPSVLACQGIPFGFEVFVEQHVDPQAGPSGPPEMRRSAMPTDMTLIHFPPFPEQGDQ